MLRGAGTTTTATGSTATGATATVTTGTTALSRSLSVSRAGLA